MEKIKLLEVDIDIDKLLKKGGETNETIQELKASGKAYEKSLKEGREVIKSYEKSLKDLENQGKKNSEEYKEQKATLDALNETQKKKQVSLEQNNAELRAQQAEYRKVKKEIDVYNGSVNKELGIITKTNGSNKELRVALANNREIYRGLTKEQKANTEVGGKLLKLITEQRLEYEKEEKSLGNNAVSVGRYKDEISELISENTNLNQSFDNQLKRLPLVGNLLSFLFGGMTKYAKAQRTATTATNVGSKALGRFRLALISTGIGAIVVLFGSLVAAFASTQSGLDSINRALAPVRGAFQGVLSVVQKLAVNVFQQLSDRWTITKNTLLIGIKEIRIGWNKITFDEEEANRLIEEQQVLIDEVNAAQARLNKKTEEFGDILSNAGDEISEAARRQQLIFELGIEIEKMEIRNVERQGLLNREIKAQNKIAEDTTKTLQEREIAVLKSIEASKELLKQEQAILDTKIKQMELEQQQTDTSRADELELAKLKKERYDVETTQLELQTTQQNKLNTIRNQVNQKAIQAAKKRAETEIKNSQIVLNQYLIENENINNTLNQRIIIFNELLEKEKDILEKQLNAKKITREEFNLRLLKLEKDHQKNIADATVENLNKELELYIASNQSKVGEGEALTDELVQQESDRLSQIHLRRLEILEQQKTDELISEQDFQIKKLELQAAFIEQQKTLDESFSDQQEQEKQRQLEIEEIDFQNNLELRRLRGESEFELRYEQLERERQLELDQAEKKGLDLLTIEQKYAERQKQIDDAVQDAKLAGIAATAGQIKDLFGEQTAIAKAAAITETSINTYKSATAAYAALAGIPVIGPGLGIAAAGTAIASGLNNVAQITGIQLFEEGGLAKGPSHAQGGIPFTIAGQPGYEMEGEEYIVNKKATAMFLPLLEQINRFGKKGNRNRPGLFQNGGIASNLIGIGSGRSGTFNEDSLAEKIGVKVGEAYEKLPPSWVAVEDINTGQARAAEVIDGASL